MSAVNQVFSKTEEPGKNMFEDRKELIKKASQSQNRQKTLPEAVKISGKRVNRR